HFAARTSLISHQPNRFRRRSNKLYAAGFTHLGEVGAFGKKSISRMDRVGVREFGSTDHAGNVQVAVRAFGRANTYGFICEPHMKRVPVGFRKNGNGFDAEFFTRKYDPKGNLT